MNKLPLSSRAAGEKPDTFVNFYDEKKKVDTPEPLSISETGIDVSESQALVFCGGVER